MEKVILSFQYNYVDEAFSYELNPSLGFVPRTNSGVVYYKVQVLVGRDKRECCTDKDRTRWNMGWVAVRDKSKRSICNDFGKIKRDGYCLY